MSRPNLLFILTDDQGAWAMECAGNAELSTPSLNRLAREGTRFQRFYCVSPVCSPARASILTGSIPSQHGVHDWLAAGYIDSQQLAPRHAARLTANPPDPQLSWARGAKLATDRAQRFLTGRRTFTQDLAEEGYQCALAGKWHLGDSGRPQAGFTWWRTIAMGGDDYYHATVLTDDGFDALDGVYITDHIADDALAFLAERDEGRPFCLCVHFTAPHSPWEREQHPPDEWAMYDDCAFASTPNPPLHPHSIYKKKLRTPEELASFRKTALHGYFAAISAMDRNVGRILARLDELGLAKDTLVVFTGDNGMSMGHHGIYGKGNGTFPQNMYEEAVLVPAIMRWPGRVPAGRVSRAMLSHYDLYPTLMEALDSETIPPQGLPGISFARHLLGGGEQSAQQVVLCDEYGPVRMIRSERWKYVHRYPYGPHELYDMEADPCEEINLTGDPRYRATQERLRAALEEWFLRYADPAKDGRSEAVTGDGQIGPAGGAAHGREPYIQGPISRTNKPDPPIQA